MDGLPPRFSVCSMYHSVQLFHSGMGDGRAYCFLPLPVKTGLPAVHINGLFELSRLVPSLLYWLSA